MVCWQSASEQLSKMRCMSRQTARTRSGNREVAGDGDIGLLLACTCQSVVWCRIGSWLKQHCQAHGSIWKAQGAPLNMSAGQEGR